MRSLIRSTRQTSPLRTFLCRDYLGNLWRFQRGGRVELEQYIPKFSEVISGAFGSVEEVDEYRNQPGATINP
jgi:hypothetical protein